MKITKDDFLEMQEKYKNEVREGKPAQDFTNKEKKNQTNSIFFDRGTLERILAQTKDDPNVGGIVFYFTEYTEEVAKKFYPSDYKSYVGLLTLVMKAANKEEHSIVTVKNDWFENRGTSCPPTCEIWPWPFSLEGTQIVNEEGTLKV